MTKQAFLNAYRALLVSTHAWAQDEAKLNRFMASVEDTIKTHSRKTSWSKDGKAAMMAWREIGGKGKPSYRALRALPDNSEEGSNTK